MTTSIVKSNVHVKKQKAVLLRPVDQDCLLVVGIAISLGFCIQLASIFSPA